MKRLYQEFKHSWANALVVFVIVFVANLIFFNADEASYIAFVAVVWYIVGLSDKEKKIVKAMTTPPYEPKE